jgi:hypothetical protein
MNESTSDIRILPPPRRAASRNPAAASACCLSHKIQSVQHIEPALNPGCGRHSPSTQDSPEQAVRQDGDGQQARSRGRDRQTPARARDRPGPPEGDLRLVDGS